jgi:hypothetical protein
MVAGVSIPLYYYSTTVWFDDQYEAARSDILQTWLAENNQRLLDIKLDEKNKIIFLALTGPKQPVWFGDLHADLKQNMVEDGLDIDFKIQSNWTRSVQISWPPPTAGELKPQQIVKAAIEKLELIRSEVWGWKRTRYSGGVWNGSNTVGDYTVAFSRDDKLSVKTSCGKLESDYQVSQGSIEIEPIMPGDCVGNSLDAMFVNDLDLVIDYQIRGDTLVLELGSGKGAMFFTRISQGQE